MVALVVILGKKSVPPGIGATPTVTPAKLCNLECNNGECVLKEVEDINNNATLVKECRCDEGYHTKGAQPCMEKVVKVEKDKRMEKVVKDKIVAFLISFFAGGFGADWFYLSNGHGGYICAGVFKLLTLGGLGIWWLVDWIRVLCDSFPDADGVYPA